MLFRIKHLQNEKKEHQFPLLPASFDFSGIIYMFYIALFLLTQHLIHFLFNPSVFSHVLLVNNSLPQADKLNLGFTCKFCLKLTEIEIRPVLSDILIREYFDIKYKLTAQKYFAIVLNHSWL